MPYEDSPDGHANRKQGNGDRLHQWRKGKEEIGRQGPRRELRAVHALTGEEAVPAERDPLPKKDGQKRGHRDGDQEGDNERLDGTEDRTHPHSARPKSASDQCRGYDRTGGCRPDRQRRRQPPGVCSIGRLERRGHQGHGEDRQSQRDHGRYPWASQPFQGSAGQPATARGRQEQRETAQEEDGSPGLEADEKQRGVGQSLRWRAFLWWRARHGQAEGLAGRNRRHL